MSVDVRRMPIRFAALIITLLGLLAWASDARANPQAADIPVFDVGAAAKNINPDTPQYIGGYGYKAGPTTNVHDDLEARAFVVGKGDQANVFVVVDSTGWFAAYNSAEASPYGVDKTRERVAEALNEQGYDITRANVIISTTHVHAAPAVVGIWGTLDATYLKKMADQVVAAASEAAENARPSEIWTGVGDLRSFIWQNGQGTNHPDGFVYDNEVPVMWARDPETGATNAIYASVPNHPDQFNGEDNDAFSADWPGYARRALDELNGGTTVIGPGTLGKQEPPGSVNTYDEVIPQGRIVANEIQRTLAKATPLTDDTIAASEQYMQTPADNDDLIFAMNIFTYPGSCIDALEICTIPRSTAMPYLDSSGDGDPLIGTHVATVRIGDAVYTTNPGEAFSEVNFATRAGISGARYVGTLSQSGDMLGYYYERGDYTEQQFGSSNFENYNVGPDMPKDNVAAALAGAEAIGFSTTPQTVRSVYNADVADRPGLQWYPTEVESASETVNILGGATKSQDETVPAPATIQWDFDDGTTPTTNNGERFDHTFPGPGTYDVVATVVGGGKTRSWEQQIIVNPDLQATATYEGHLTQGASLLGGALGGSGKVVAAHWTCQDGTKVSGINVVCKSPKAGTASVTVVDGAGNTAETTVAVPKAPPAKPKITRIKVKPKKIRYGKKGTMTVTLKNLSTTTATKVKVCVKVPARAKKLVKVAPSCKSPGALRSGKAASVPIGIKVSRKARPGSKVKLQVTVSASGAKKKTASIALKGKPGGMTSSSYAAG
ncbi:MAG: PKD domain-containing protein [Solirubrobacterales bacterium]|nr:PKD domain-containing protein [Solirubrobacterales bacterium]